MFRLTFLSNTDGNTTSSTASPTKPGTWYLPLGEWVIGRGKTTVIVAIVLRGGLPTLLFSHLFLVPFSHLPLFPPTQVPNLKSILENFLRSPDSMRPCVSPREISNPTIPTPVSKLKSTTAFTRRTPTLGKTPPVVPTSTMHPLPTGGRC